MKKIDLVSALLRMGVAFTFFYASFASLLYPNSWIGYYPLWIKDLIPERLLLTGFSLYELVLGILLILKVKPVFTSILSGLTVLGIIVFNLSIADVIFRDVTIVFACAALALLSSSGD